MFCTLSIGPGDVFIVCLKKPVSYLKLSPAVASGGNNSLTIPVTSQTEFALTPPNKEGDGSDTAIKSWEGEFKTLGVFFKDRKSQGMPMPAVCVMHTTVLSA